MDERCSRLTVYSISMALPELYSLRFPLKNYFLPSSLLHFFNQTCYYKSTIKLLLYILVIFTLLNTRKNLLTKVINPQSLNLKTCISVEVEILVLNDKQF